MRFLTLFSLLVLVYVSSSAKLPVKIDLPQANFTQHSGYITIDPSKDANIFYWLTESQNNPATDPLVLWMTGGPGCSSELALLFENGPWTVNPNLTLSENPYSWNKIANILYIDQPVGTGFSYANSDYIHNEAQVSTEVWTFLQGFLTKYPQYAKLDFYIIGESYGGHYVPSVAYKVIQQNQANRGIQINLKAIGVGNGWVDPLVQYGSYGPYAYMNRLISTSTYAAMNQTYIKCMQYIQNKQWDAAQQVCSTIMEAVLEEAGNINVYNIKLPCIGPLCYDFTTITQYMNLPEVKSRLGVKPGLRWSTCNFDIGPLFSPDNIESFRFEFPFILQNGLRVVIYSGNLDLICNYIGGYEWVSTMVWPGQTAFNSAPHKTWLVDGVPAGMSVNADKLTFVEVFEAGHMVPHDQPKNALAILQNIIENKPFL